MGDTLDQVLLRHEEQHQQRRDGHGGSGHQQVGLGAELLVELGEPHLNGASAVGDYQRPQVPFHPPMNVNNPLVMNTGLDSGTITLQRYLNLPHPSICAASHSSSGMV